MVADSTTPPSILSDLLETRSGISYVYDLLGQLQQRWDFDDAVVVIDDEECGRSAFRLGQKPITAGWAATVAAESPPGLYVEPEVELPGAQRSLVVGLAGIALRMDVLRHRSLTDPLTGLRNRAGFEKEYRTASERAQRFGEPFAICMIDLDGFKAINDEFGHPFGDRMLEGVGQAIQQRLRTVDVAARVGGDEFAVLLPRTTADDISIVVDRLRRAIQELDTPLPLSASFGSAFWPTDAEGLQKLYEVADDRLYSSKVDS